MHIYIQLVQISRDGCMDAYIQLVQHLLVVAEHLEEAAIVVMGEGRLLALRPHLRRTLLCFAWKIASG